MVNVQPASAGAIPHVREFDPTPIMGFRIFVTGRVHAFYLPEQSLEIVKVPHPMGVNPLDYFKKELKEPLEINPWRDEPFFRNNIETWAPLLPRPSVTQPGMVAYYQSDEKRRRDIQTPIKAGRFLQKYFGNILNQTEIQRLALEWETEFKVPEVEITQDADEIEEIYENGPYSCMAKSAYSFSGRTHPCRVYAGPDLGLAYIGPVDAATARCIVWPDKKIYCSTQYGDEPRIRAALEAIGYRRASSGEFTGARIRRLMYHDRYIVPYSDTHDTASDDGQYLILSDDGDIGLRDTDGVSGYAYRCEDCGDGMSEDDSYYIGSEGYSVCSSCYTNGYFYCEESGEDYPDSEMADTPDGYRVSKKHVQRSPEWFYCEITEKYYPDKDYEAVELFEGETCEESHAANNGFWCQKSKSWSLDHSEKVTLPNGLVVHRDAFDSEDEMAEFGQIASPTTDDPNQLSFLEEAA